jgi:hypothetical protein
MAGGWRDNPRSVGERFWSTTTVNRVAVLAAILWVVLVLSYAGGYFAGGGVGQARGTAFLDAVFFLIALVLPLGLIALAAWMAAEVARLRSTVADLIAVSAPLAEALAETRTALAEEGPLKPRDLDRFVRYAMGDAEASIRREMREAIEDALAQVREGQRRMEAAMALAARAAPPAPLPAPALDKARAAAEPEADGPDAPAHGGRTLPAADLVRALDFPRDPEDAEGFRALKRAQRDPSLAAMLQAAEDVLNLLSQQGVFTDDLRPDPAAPAAWRALMAPDGDEATVDAVAGIHDPRALDAVRGLADSEPIFRDTVQFFQRRFRRILAAHAAGADDETLLALADTRSGRAFQLSARAMAAPPASAGAGAGPGQG